MFFVINEETKRVRKLPQEVTCEREKRERERVELDLEWDSRSDCPQDTYSDAAAE